MSGRVGDAPVIVASQFRGPPNSGNGGYVCGLLAERLAGSIATGVLRAPIPIDTPLRLEWGDGEARLTGFEGDLIAEAREAEDADLPAFPPAPDVSTAAAAGRRFVGLSRPFHPVCFTCASALEDGFGLRVFVGPVDGHDEGLVAGPWVAHENFADRDGRITLPVIWAALDCPGSVAWVERAGGWGGGLLGTMTCEVRRRPRAGESCVVAAWPLEASGRKRISATVLYGEGGEPLARSRQVWIVRAPPPPSA